MEEIVIVSAVRTAVGKFQGSLSGFTAPQLGAIAVREAVNRAGVGAALLAGCATDAATESSAEDPEAADTAAATGSAVPAMMWIGSSRGYFLKKSTVPCATRPSSRSSHAREVSGNPQSGSPVYFLTSSTSLDNHVFGGA